MKRTNAPSIDDKQWCIYFPLNCGHTVSSAGEKRRNELRRRSHRNDASSRLVLLQRREDTEHIVHNKTCIMEPRIPTIEETSAEPRTALLLDYNLYWKRLPAIQKIKAPSTRAAVVGRAMARVEKKPSLAGMDLSRNHDVACCCLLNEARDVSASSLWRKPSRSLSVDTLIALCICLTTLLASLEEEF
jgi:hypothetical protein